ncbi:MAG: polyprenyl synthetase family protein [Rickettsiella sp.]|nr:polyprenyl synthetase family protein [Rickettsiella sp.]
MIRETQFLEYQQRINHFLAACLKVSGPSETLYECMRYSVLEGGKRLRPILMYFMSEALGGFCLEKLDHAACSIELIHAYSLIHDDLPIMDNDDWRRGKPSCHKVFGEAIALLAGDALQALAFEILLKVPLSPSHIVAMLKILTKAVGRSGMVGGQAMEFSKLLRPLNRVTLETINVLKTGALFRASLELTGIVNNVSPEALVVLGHLGDSIGICYQFQDDINDNAGEIQDRIDKENDSLSLLVTSLEDLEALLPAFPKQNFMRIFPLLFSEYKKLQEHRENSFL